MRPSEPPPPHDGRLVDASADPDWMSDGVVVLRRVVRDDAADILDAVRTSLDHLRPWMQWATDDVDRTHVDHFIDQVESGHEHSFAIRGRERGRFLGTCALNRVDLHHRTANLGFWLRSGATGRGVATRAARMVLVHGLTTMGLERIEVVVSVANGPSLVAFTDDVPRLVAETQTA